MPGGLAATAVLVAEGETTGVLVILAIGAIIVALIVRKVFNEVKKSSRCPKCGKDYALDLMSSGVTGRRQEQGMVKRTERMYGPNGQFLGVVEREEPGMIEKINHTRHYKCKYCGHTTQEHETWG